MKYISILILSLILIINSILLTTKIKKYTKFENFSSLQNINYERQREQVNILKGRGEMGNNVLSNEQNKQDTGLTNLMEYITGENTRRAKAKTTILDNIKKNNPLNDFKLTKGVSCQDMHINISDNISSNIGSDDLLIKTCAKECHKNPKCLSFDYSNKKCRLSTWCINSIGKNKNNSSIYQDKTKPIPNITKFNLKPNKKMYGEICKMSQIGPKESKSNITDCAEKCFKNNNCLSWDVTGNNNICRIYSKCHKHTMTNENKSFVGLKRNTVLYGIPGNTNNILRTRYN